MPRRDYEPIRETGDQRQRRQVDTGEVRRMADSLTSLEKPTPHRLGVRTSSMGHEVSLAPPAFWVKLGARDAGTGAYAWLEMWDHGDGTFSVLANGRSGTTTTNQAYEVRGRIIAEGELVRLHLSYDGIHFLFAWVPAPPGSPPCGAIVFQDYQSRCIDGTGFEYFRNVTVTTVGGCLVREELPWQKGYALGCCDCPPPPPPFPPPATIIFIISQFIQIDINNNEWIWNGFEWVEFCPCGSFESGSGPSGSGDSGSGSCQPGTCALCDDPPGSYTVSVTGFTGAAAVFNREWDLPNTSACVYSLIVLVNGLPTSCLLTLTATGATLTFEQYNGAVIEASASYVAPLPDLPDCCPHLTFHRVACTPDGGGVGTVNSCTSCTTAPDTYTGTFAAFTGCLTVFNGTWTFTHTTLCSWHAASGTRTLDVSLGGAPGAANASLVLFDSASHTAPVRADYSVNNTIANCCASLVLGRNSSSCQPAPLMPATVTLVPDCTGPPPSSCPAFLTAIPHACLCSGESGSSGSTGSSGGSGAGGDICPGSPPPPTLNAQCFRSPGTPPTIPPGGCASDPFVLTWNGLPLGGGLEYTGTVTLADGTLGVTIRPDPADITGHSWCLDSTGCDTTTCFHTTDFSCSPVYMHFTPSLNVACCGDSGSTFLVVTG